MCDALSRNKPKNIEVTMANCMDHARRGFVDLPSKHPAEVQYFVEKLGTVYHQDRLAKRRGLTAAAKDKTLNEN